MTVSIPLFGVFGGIASAKASVDDDVDRAEAVRFLRQATFGPTEAEIEALVEGGISDWLVGQFAAPQTDYLPLVEANLPPANSEYKFRTFVKVFQERNGKGEDQLRQRMTFALSQIFVISAKSALVEQPRGMAYFGDILQTHAFGNFRDLLEAVTYSPAMARYLTYLNNAKGDPQTGSLPDENYAREILQLFSIGVVKLKTDGRPRKRRGEEIETYDIEDIENLARVFTGLGPPGGFNTWPYFLDDSGTAPLAAYDEWHSTESKSFLGCEIPANTGAEESIDLALDCIAAHPNVGPFIGRQLIQRFTMSDPKPVYVRRVAKAFNRGTFKLPDGAIVGSGERGDLAATLAAVLLAPTVRDLSKAGARRGKVREPYLRYMQMLRALDFDPAYIPYSATFLENDPFTSPSVFNFYRPGYRKPRSVTAAARLDAPELQIVNDLSMRRYVEAMRFAIRWYEFDAFGADYSELRALADDPEALVDRLDDLLTGGEIPDDAKDRIVDILEEIPLRSGWWNYADRLTRVHNAVMAVVTTPAYIVQR